MTLGMTCPKCGLVQLSAPLCKACGASTGRPTAPVHARPRPAAGGVGDGALLTPLPPARGGELNAGALFGSGKKRREFAFHGRGRSLFGIFVVNTLFTLLTLGIYRFWAKTRVRRYLLSETEFEGDRFAYHGTGGELFLGFLRAVALFWAPLLLVNVATSILGGPHLQPIVRLVTPALALVFLPIAIVGARRYRLSRTSWRGVRFSFRGSTRQFIALFAIHSLLTTLTLGLYYPFFLTRRYAFLTAHSHFGTLKADFDGEGRALFGSFLLAVVLTPVTLGLCWVWFLAKKSRYLWAHTTLGDARFDSSVTGSRLLGLYLVDALLLLPTLGLAWPWVAVRNVRFTLHNLSLHGHLDFEAIRQDVRPAGATGEALSGLLDAGFDLG